MRDLIKGLASRPEALLITACLAAMVLLAKFGVSGGYAVGGPSLIYVLYMANVFLGRRHENQALDRQLAAEERKQLAKVEAAAKKRDTRSSPKGVTSLPRVKR
ncbi:hypothetical protein [Aureimonas ureilytica]|uniref:hypothetical protein n=1 Tax=Aureimonas ureilytica TaxID=401562 RepID=UPI0012DF0E15|nr:hypothetical protein [Aureimonas ureilytica]